MNRSRYDSMDESRGAFHCRVSRFLISVSNVSFEYYVLWHCPDVVSHCGTLKAVVMEKFIRLLL